MLATCATSDTPSSPAVWLKRKRTASLTPLSGGNASYTPPTPPTKRFSRPSPGLAPKPNCQSGPTPVGIPNVADLALLITAVLPGPLPERNTLSGALRIDYYRASPQAFDGKQRRGIPESLPAITGPVAFLTHALSSDFPNRRAHSFTVRLYGCDGFHCRMPRLYAPRLPGTPAPHLAVRASRFLSDTYRRYAITPEPLRSATCQLHVALWAQLAEFLDLSATPWLPQFVTGFPISGVVSQGDFPHRPPPHAPLETADHALLLRTAPGRFLARARRSPVKHASDLGDEAVTQVASGRLTPPARLNTTGRFAHAPDAPCDIAFPPGVRNRKKNPKTGDFPGARDQFPGKYPGNIPGSVPGSG